jgi:hypothetical protein
MTEPEWFPCVDCGEGYNRLNKEDRCPSCARAHAEREARRRQAQALPPAEDFKAKAAGE